MYLTWGNYQFGLGVPAVTISRETVSDAAERAYMIRERWQINGIMPNPGGSAATLVTATNSLQQAFAVDGYDLILYLPDGTPSSHYLLDASCIGGTRVVQQPSFPQGTGPEGITYRTFAVAVEGDVSLINGGTNYTTSFTETLSFEGGGFLDGHLEPLIGFPVKQRRKQNTVFRATQTGEAVGLFGYPQVPFPVWPAALVSPNPKVNYRSPRRRRGQYVEYGVSWTWQFESRLPLYGLPNRWHGG